ncbi:outer membrane lipoprotein carrier protein LolA [Undibacterium sp. TJN25]|uniref:outer membrane lipoprotein carrier protein LolA n=1 Tax=Undibacterium sp. TJN25 TaxID=3413056 RepID=UPI003BF32F61
MSIANRLLRPILPILAMLALSFLPMSHAADLAASVRGALVQSPVLRGEFEQSKQVAGFKKNLLSRGDFLVAREHGVIWRTREPFASLLKLTRDEIVATQGGEIAFRLSASKEPSVRIINGLMFSLLNGDIQSLAEHFRVDGSASGKTWKLLLTPRNPALSKMISQVELAGDQYVRNINIAEANGDKTSIHFFAQSTEPAKLSPEEAARFD